MQITFGIDFGTSNSALSIYRNGTVEVIPMDPVNDDELLRSVLYFTEENEIFAGQEAIRNYVSDGAAGRFMQSIKTFLPNTNFDSTEIFGKRYAIDDLVSIILRKLKARGEAHVGCTVDSVVLGRPVVFSTDSTKDAVAQQRLEKAARKAGFKRIWFQYEPIAAALTFEATLKPGEERVVLIGDFGGGTSDFTIIRTLGGAFSRDDRKSDVLSLGGVYVAGDKFDSQLMWDRVAHHFGRHVKYRSMGKDEWFNIPKSIIYTLCQWHRIPLLRARSTREQIRMIKRSADNPRAIENLENIIDDNFGFFLFQAIEKTKCELSESRQATIRFKERGLSIEENVSKEEFEEINLGNLQQIAACIDDVIARSGLAPSQIDSVFLTGGTSRMPCIQALFTDRFGQEKLEQRNSFTSVVYGLGASVPLFT